MRTTLHYLCLVVKAAEVGFEPTPSTFKALRSAVKLLRSGQPWYRAKRERQPLGRLELAYYLAVALNLACRRLEPHGYSS